ncbi:MAG: DUF433 domain-containing protein [Rhabdochlamydiaceae bacterium]
MSVNFHKKELGVGVFTASDIAGILKQPWRKVDRYLREYGDVRFGKRLFNETYSWEVQGIRVVNFYALIEIAVFFRLRDKYHLSISKINKARESMAEALSTPYPFASNRVLADTKHIWYDRLGDLVNADKTHQLNFKEIVEPLLDKIEFEGDVASRFFPLGKKVDVVVDPHHQFGQPIVKNTNIRVETLGRMKAGGESRRNLCWLYDLSAKQVNDALRYYKQAA